ncbi:MAG: hypothetical protein KKH28_01925 [Elusimicrobia bacterium]|nr:hypothetical protein [Elusimicrobiota bacterium]
MITGFSWYRGFVTAALGAALTFLWSPGICFAGEYERLADQLVKIAKTQKLARLAISNFNAQGQAGQDEAREAQRRLSEALFKLPGIGVMDASVLEELKERGRRWAQILVTGQVYRTKTSIALVVKMINLRSGLQMAAMQITIREEAQSSFPEDFRDAPRDTRESACAKAFEQLVDANRADVELKARYWAARVREPGFSYYELDRAPGSEITDYATMQKFYILINAYYEQDGPVILTETERARLNALLKTEDGVLRKCPKKAVW